MLSYKKPQHEPIFGGQSRKIMQKYSIQEKGKAVVHIRTQFQYLTTADYNDDHREAENVSKMLF